MEYSLDVWEALVRLMKYLLEGIAVGIVSYWVTKPTRGNFNEILVIALTAAAVFAVLDVLAPAMSAGARQGAGMGAGFKLMGFP